MVILLSSYDKVILEDLTAAIEAFKKDSFYHVNVFANRIMSDATFTDSKFFLTGFFLKDLATTFGKLKTEEKATSYSTAKSHGFKFAELLKDSLSSFDEEKLWKEYQKFYNTIRKFEMDEFEEKSYSDNKDFAKETFSWLFEYIKTNKEILVDPQNLLFKGVYSEMERIFRVHSANLPEIVLMSLIQALSRYYDYFRRIHLKPDGHIDEEKVKTEIFPLVEQIEKACYPKLDFSAVNSTLWALVKGWRCFFMQRMELLPLTVRYQKGIEMPTELKEKLSETMTKILEKES